VSFWVGRRLNRGSPLVGIDASRAVSAHPTGTETYSRHLIRALLSSPAPYRFRLYFRTAPPQPLGDAETCVIPFPHLWTHARLSWEMVRRPPHLLFVPAHVLPLIHPRPSLVTIHDLGYRHFPEAHPRLQRLYLNLSTRWNARVAQHILADSQATKADLVEMYDTPPEKITVAYPGYDTSLAPVRDESALAAAKRRYGIHGEYFLHLGTLQPRKNLARLIEAFAAAEVEATLVLRGRGGQGRADQRRTSFRLPLTPRGVRAAGAGSPGVRLPRPLRRSLQPAGGRRRGRAAGRPVGHSRSGRGNAPAGK